MKQGFFRNIVKPINVEEFMATLDVAFKFVEAPAAIISNEQLT